MRTKISTKGLFGSTLQQNRKGNRHRVSGRMVFLCVLILTVAFATVLGAFSPVVLNFSSTDIFQKNEITASAATADDWLTAVDTSTADNPNTFQLTAGWSAGGGNFGTDAKAFINGALYVPSGKSVILDLNGKTLTRGMTAAKANGYVIYVKGTLVIRDTSSNGTITGGWNSTTSASYRGGGIVIDGGTVTLESGRIYNNTYSYTGSAGNYGAGGVYLASAGSRFNMSGGSIESNTGGRGAGAIDAEAGVVNITGGTITGNKSTATYATAAGAIRIAVNNTHTISNVKITNNTVAGSSAGAAFCVSSGTVNVSDATITNNSATGGTTGGAFFVSGGVVNVSESTVTGNSSSGATSAGGLRITAGTVAFKDTTLNSNTVSGATSAGGINTSGGTVTMTGGTMSSNTATSTGANPAGGAYMNSGTVRFNGTTIDNNTAGKVATAVGGIRLVAGDLYLTDTTVTNNKGILGGGVHATVSFNVAGTTVIKDNRMYVSTSSTSLETKHADVSLTAYSVRISLSGALAEGADIRVYPEEVWYTNASYAYFCGSWSSYHQGEEPSKYFGVSTGSAGEIVKYVYSSTVDCVTVQSHDNHLNWVRAVNQSGNRTFKLYSNWTATSSKFGSGTGYTSEGALYTGANGSGTFTIDLNGYTINRGLGSAATNGYVLQTRGTVIITDTTETKAGKITGGFNSGAGGGIHQYNGTLTLKGGSVTGNKSSGNGGGVYVSSSSTFYITDDAVISNNSAVTGGGIYKYNDSSYRIYIQGGTISGNTATGADGGGGIYDYAGSLEMTGGSITANKCTGTGNGGGIYFRPNSYIYLYGGSVTKNYTYNSASHGGGIYILNTSATIYLKGDFTTSGNYVYTTSRANDIELEDSSSLRITLQGALTSGEKIGVYREAGTLFTRDFAKYHPGANAEDYFTAQRSGYFVETDSTGEASFNSNNPADAWKIAVVESKSQSKQFTVTMVSNWTASGSGTSTSFGTDTTAYNTNGLYVPSGANVVLDLNGHTINRNLNAALSGGFVIYVNGGTLTIKDSSEGKTGKITGGNNSASGDTAGGGISIGAGTVYFEGGTITGNKSSNTTYGAGGVLVRSNGYFYMRGGKITGNTGGAGGGVLQMGSYTVRVSGSADISGNVLTDNTKSDLRIASAATYKYITVEDVLADDAHIGLSYDANNYDGSSNVVTLNYSRYNDESDLNKHFFPSETNRFMLTGVKSGSYTEVKIICTDATTNWTNAYNASSSSKWVDMQLYQDWTALTDTSFKKSFGTGNGFSNGSIYLTGSRHIRLDLAGYTINRALTSSTATDTGYVFYINTGYLEINDSSDAKTGKITGGYSSGTTGGGIYLKGGTLYLYGGTITKNVCDKGGGVYVPTTDCNIYVGGDAIVMGNTARNGTANNIYAEKGNYRINVSSRGLSEGRDSSEKIGFFREAMGEFTTDFPKYMTGKDPANYFSLDMNSAFVITSAAGEGAVDTNNSVLNWLYAVKGSISTGLQMTCTLRSNWTGSASTTGFGSDTDAYNNGGLYVPSTANVILDLNGYTLNRGYSNSSSGQSYGWVIYVLGQLVVRDTSESQKGTIKGGYNTINATSTSVYYAGAGINVGNNNSAVLTIEGGTITGNKSTGTNGVGGIYVHTGRLIMKGGTVTGNSGTRTGGVLINNSNYYMYAQGDVVIEKNTLTTGAASDLSFVNANCRMSLQGALGDNAHIGFTPLTAVNNYTSAYGQVVTSNYSRYHTADDFDVKIFTSGASEHGIETYRVSSSSFEATLVCYDPQVNWINACAASSASSPKTMKLYGDWTATYHSSYTTSFHPTNTSYFRNGGLFVPNSDYVILDLNGYTLNRALTSTRASGYVIWVNGSGRLEIKDSSDARTGKITGGRSNDTVGGIHLVSGAYFKMESGTVTKNTGSVAGGINVVGTATMYYGGYARVEENKLTSGVASNIFIENATTMITISSELMTEGHGIGRAGLGDLTKNFYRYHSEPTKYFVSELTEYYIAKNTDSGEVCLMSYYNHINWQYAVQTSVSTGRTQTVRLTGNWTADYDSSLGTSFGTGTGYYNGMLAVPSKGSVILDLAGYTINRNMKSVHSNGGVFRIEGSLTIRDDSDEGTGKITGGFTNSSGSYTPAGGISILSSGVVVMYGGSVTKNESSTHSGGVYVYSGGSFSLRDTASVIDNKGLEWGGVYVRGTGYFNVAGKAQVTNNVYTKTVSRGLPSNVVFETITNKVNVVAPLTEGASIGLTRAVNNSATDGSSVMTKNLGKYNAESADTYFFASEAPDYGVIDFYTAGVREAGLFCYNNEINWRNAVSTSISKKNTQTVTLFENWSAVSNSFGTSTGYTSNGALRVPSNASIILDLNGFTLNRKLTSAISAGEVIYVEGYLKIINSSENDANAVITGGYTTASWTDVAGVTNAYLLNSARAGGVHVVANGRLILEGGTIKNNKGAGVYVATNGDLGIGGKAVVQDNTVALNYSQRPANIFLEAEGQMIRVVSKITSNVPFGVIRTKAKESFASGTLTTGYGKYNPDNPEVDKVFKSDDPRYYVVVEGEAEDGDVEALIISDDGRTNWQYAIKTSLANNGRTQKFTLYKDWIAETTENGNNTEFGSGTGFSGGQLYVPAGASIILDLNGYKIDRRLNAYYPTNYYGGILYVRGTLRIIDSNTRGATGLMTGAYTCYYGGHYANGVGAISIYMGTVIMEGGKLSGNYGTNGTYGTGGVYMVGGATFKMTGGEISGNYGRKVGGVYANRDVTLQLGGSAKIYDNKLLDKENYRTNTKCNLWCYENKTTVQVVSAFTEEANICFSSVYTMIPPSGYRFTVGWSNFDQPRKPDKVFVSDAPDDYVAIDEIEKSINKIEAIVVCLDNQANWAMAVKTSLKEKNTQTVKLYSNWRPASGTSFGSGTGYTSGAIYVPNGASIILDLNGYTIDRELSRSQSCGNVFYIGGKLKVIDSSAEILPDGGVRQGTIRGGYDATGGAFYMNYEGDLTLEGGNIAYNTATSRGGAIYINNGKALTLGGTVAFYNNYVDRGGDNWWYSDIDLVAFKNPITITGELTTKAAFANSSTSVSTNWIRVKKNAIGQITNGWGETNPGTVPTARFVTEYNDAFSVVSIGNGRRREAVMMSGSNAKNWEYTVAQSLKTKETQTFVLVREKGDDPGWWANANYWTKTYDGRFGSDTNYYRYGGLYVPKGASIVFDFNGLTISRRTWNDPEADKKYTYPEYNFVMYVEGTVQFVNTNLNSTGYLTGGSYGVYLAGGEVIFGPVVPPTGTTLADVEDEQTVYAFEESKLGDMRISSNFRYGVYLETGVLTLTGGQITNNSPSDVYVCEVNNDPETGGDVNAKAQVNVGLDAYVYTMKSGDPLSTAQTDKIKYGSLQFADMLDMINVIAPLSNKARIGYHRGATGQLTVGYGKYHPNADAEQLRNTFIRQEDIAYTLVLTTVDGEREGVVGSYDNATNWQYAVTKSLKTGKVQRFNMYSCWEASPHSSYGTAFGTTSAFYSGALYVPEGAKIELNLNGHKLDRHLAGASARANGYVLYVGGGTVTIIDTPVQLDDYTPDCRISRDEQPITCPKQGQITGGHNSGGSSAGAIYIAKGACTMKAGVVYGNKATSTSGSSGAVYTAGTFTMEGGTIRDNTGGNAGAIYATTGATVNLKSGTISGNTSTGAGAGAIYTAGTFNMTNGTVTGNHGTVGGVYVASGGNFTMSNGTITLNGSQHSSAGAVFVANSADASFTMNGGTVSENTGMASGGIYVAGNVTINGGSITKNIAVGSDTEPGGSAIYIAGSGNVTVLGGTITQNTGKDGVRVFSTGILNLGNNAKIFGNTELDTGKENDVFLVDSNRKINIVSEFKSANIGIYRENAGVFTDSYGLYNAKHPNVFFHSNEEKYAICKTVTDGDLSAEAAIGTPIKVEPSAVKPAPVYDGNYQSIIVGYDPNVMTATTNLNLYPFTKWETVTVDDKTELQLQAVNAGTYMITFVPNDGYCWGDGNNAPKMFVGDLMPRVVELEWTDETHDGNPCVYEPSTQHGPTATVKTDSLMFNVAENQKDTCNVEVAGWQVTAGEHTASALTVSNPNYTVPEGAAGEHKFRIEKAELPDFKIKTDKTGYMVPTEIEVEGNIENGKLTYQVDAVDKDKGRFEGNQLIASAGINETVSITVTVAETTNYKEKSATQEVKIIAVEFDPALEETETTYGEKMELKVKGYNELMGGVTFKVDNLTGKAELVTVDGKEYLNATGAGKVSVTVNVLGGEVNGKEYYKPSSSQIEITIKKRVIALDWKNSLSVVYDGEEHGFDNNNLNLVYAGVDGSNDDPTALVIDGVFRDDMTARENKEAFRIRIFAGGVVGWEQAANAAIWTDAGKYDLGVVLSDPENYAFATEAEYYPVFEITKKSITLSFEEPLEMHEGVPYAPVVLGNENNAPVTFTVTEGSASYYSYDAGKKEFTSTKEGTGHTIKIKATVAETNNFQGGEIEAEFKLVPATLPLKLVKDTVTYGETDFRIEITGNEVEGVAVPVTLTFDATLYDNFATFDSETLILIPKKVGTVKIHAVATPGENDVFYYTEVDLEVTILPKEVEIEWTWTQAEKYVYDDDTFDAPGAAVKNIAEVGNDEVTVSVKFGYYEAGANGEKTFTEVDWADRHAREYVARAVVSNVDGNYAPTKTSAELKFTVHPKVAVLEWTAPASSLVYNGKDQAPEVKVTNLKEGDSCIVTVVGTKNAGTGLVARAMSLNNSDYTLEGAENLSSMEFTIVPKQITVTWEGLEGEEGEEVVILTYTGRPQAPVAIANDLEEGDECEVNVIGQQTNVGEGYRATAFSLSNPNYALKSGIQHITFFNITKAKMEAKLAENTAIYGTIYELKVEGNPEKGSISFTFSDATKNKMQLAESGGVRMDPVDIGDAVVTVTVGETENYQEVTFTETITILPRPVTVKWEDTDFQYDGEKHNPVATVENTVHGDLVDLILSDAIVNAGTYTASVEGVSDKKYTLDGGENMNQKFEITARPVTVTWSNTSVVYNGAMQYPTVEFGNLVEGDVIYPTLEGSKDVVTKKECAILSLNTPNYYIQDGEDDSVRFTVTPYKAEIEWGETKFTYNGLEQGPEAKVTNLLGDDTCDVIVSGKQINVGEYTATASSLSNANYTLVDVENLDIDFTIEKANMDVTLADSQVTYGQTLVIALVGVEGDALPTTKLKNGTGRATLDGDDLTALAVGTVYLNVKIPESDNYNAFGGADGYDFEIEIIPQPVELEWEYDDYVYNGKVQHPVPSVTNLYEGDSCTLTVEGQSDAGNNLTARVTALSNPNYTLDEGTGITATYAIQPKTVGVVWGTQTTFSYNGEKQGPTASAVKADLIAGDTCGIEVDGWAIDAGIYTATASRTNNVNYIVEGRYDDKEESDTFGEVVYPTKDFEILRSTPKITLVTRTVTVGGTDGKLEIEGNVGGGTVTYTIVSAKDKDGNTVAPSKLAEIQGDVLVAHKIGFVTVHVVVGETANTDQAECDGEIEIIKGYATLKLTKTTVSYGSTLTLTLDDDRGNLLNADGTFVFGPVTFKVHDEDKDKAEIFSNVFRGKAAGTVRIIMSIAESDNFYAKEETAEITVTPRIVTLEWVLPETPFVYNGERQAPTAKVTNLLTGDACNVTVTVLEDGGVNAGSHIAETSGLSNPNYTLERATNTQYTYEIQKRALSVTWGELVLTYTGEAQTPEALIEPLEKDKDNCTVLMEICEVIDGTVGSIVSAINVGTYRAKTTGVDNENYVLTSVGMETDFEIVQAELDPTFAPDSVKYLETKNLGMEGILDPDIRLEDVTFTVLSHESEGNVTIENGKMTGTRAGEVRIRVNVPGTVNCKPYVGVLTVTVEKADREVDLLTKEGRYGDDFKLLISGNDAEPGTVTFELVDAENADGALIAELQEGKIVHSFHKGSLRVKVVVGETDNYKEGEYVFNLKILPRIAQFKWETTEFTYDGTPKVPTAVISNIVPGNEIYKLTVMDPHIDADTYSASVTSIGNPDYTLDGSNSKNTFFTIGKKEIKLTLVTTHIRSGQPEQLLVDGNEGNEPVIFEIVEGAGTGTAELRENENGVWDIICGTKLGTVLVTATVKAREGSNYTGATVTSLIIIEKTMPDITLKTDTVRYGTDLLLQLEGNVENGTVIFSSANDTGMASLSGNLLHPTRAGKVYITVTVGPTANYAAFSGVFEVEITPLPVTLRWMQFEFTYDGISKFAPTAKVVGMINGDTCDVIVEGAQMNAGTYNSLSGPANLRITKAVELTNQNYVLAEGADVYAPTFVINKAKQVVYLVTTVITLGEPTKLLVGGNVGKGDEWFYVTPGTGDATVSGNMITGTALGTITVVVSVQESDNYLFATASGTITVEKPAAPVELESITVQYGDDLVLEIKEGTNPDGGAFTFALDPTDLATLNGNVLHANGVGEVKIIVTVAETENYKSTVKEITVTITKRSVTAVWTIPELIYNGEELFPTATVGNLVGNDQCDLTVTGAIHAGVDIESTVIGLTNTDYYTLEGGTDLTALFTIKPRPVKLSWSEEEFTYNGEVQTPTATVVNLYSIDGVEDSVEVETVGMKDVLDENGEKPKATAVGVDNTDYTVEGGENITHEYTILPYAVDVEWGALHLVYTGEVLVPTATAVGTFNGEACLATVTGDGIKASLDPYTATVTGLNNPNYCLKSAPVDTLAEGDASGAITTDYYIDRKELILTDAELTKVYNGAFQQPSFNLFGFHENDEVLLTFVGEGQDEDGNSKKGGGIDAGTYKITLVLDGEDCENYVLNASAITQWFEITPLTVTVKLSTNQPFADVEFDGKPITLPDGWYVLTTDGFVGDDKNSSVTDIFKVNELDVSPRFKKGDVYYDTLSSRGTFSVIPVLNGGELKGAQNYKAIISIDENYGIVTVSVGAKTQLTKDSKYQFLFETEDDYGWYRTTYAEADMEHGKGDTDIDRVVLGQILPGTTIAVFVANFVTDEKNQITLYKGTVAVYANGAVTAGYDDAFVGTGWRMEYGSDAIGYDTVYLSVLGDLDGDGEITREGDAAVLIAYNHRQVEFSVEFRLAAYIGNSGTIDAYDVYLMCCILNDDNSMRIEDFYYQPEASQEA